MVTVWLIGLGIVGLLLSGFIHHKKRKKEKLVCVIGEDCDKVINSRFSEMMGVPNEVLGMLFYAAIIGITMFLTAGMTSVSSFSLITVRFIMSGVAALFSLFLTYIQLVLLKEWCEYCLVNAAVTIAIFGVQWI